MNRIDAIFIFIPSLFLGQFFNYQGDVTQLDFETYAMTQDIQNQASMMTFVFPVDITQNFSIDFQVNFGTHDINGGEGLAFILSNDCVEELQTGGNLGIENMPNSLIVDFDTNFSGTNNNDLQEDHNGIYNNGSFSNGSNLMDSGPTPVCLLPGCVNVEDGNWHQITLNWIYVTDNEQILEVYFDGNFLSSSTANHRNQRFNNNQFVFWSISASTGINSNLQQIKFYDEDFIFDTEFEFCNGDAFTLTAPPFGSEYVWSHNASTTNVADYIAEQSEIISCNYLDYCGRPQQMDFNIIVETPEARIENNGPICIGEDAIFNIIRNPNDQITYIWDENTYTQQANGNGEIFFTVPNALNNESITITQIITPSGCILNTNIISEVVVLPLTETTGIITN